MGCHTWFYRKSDLSIERVRLNWLERNAEIIKECEKALIDPLDYFSNYKLTKSQVEWYLKIYKRQRRMVEKGLCNCAVMNNQPFHSLYLKGHGFYIEEGTHDLFRIGGYPEIYLFSYQETIDFIKQYEITEKMKVKFCENGKKRLKEFWSKNKDGMICFG